MDKVISSPLTYWGGKRWLFKTVFDLIPEGETEIFSPFLGGGGIEINFAYRGYKVYAYDSYQPLINFWEHWLNNPESVRRNAYELLSLYARDDLNKLRKKHKWSNDISSAVFFIICNRLCYNGKLNRSILEYGLDENGDYIRNPKRGTFEGKNRLFRDFDFWQSKPLSTLNIQCADFESVFWMHQHQFAYIDPPYFERESEYGGSRENGFNHKKLHELLGSREKWVLSYNDHPEAHRLYNRYHIQPIKRGSDGRTELLILSPDIAERITPQPEQITLFS